MGVLCLSTSADKAVRLDVSGLTKIVHRITSKTRDTPLLASRGLVEGAEILRKLFRHKEGGRNTKILKIAQ